MTPEGEVKKVVKEYLDSIGCISAARAPLVKDHTGYYFIPVSIGMGVHGIPDIIGHYRGFFFAIETKVEGKNPTPLQYQQLKAIDTSRAKAFCIRGINDLGQLTRWKGFVDGYLHQIELNKK